jgi:ATP phosphoribosyltransferase
MNITRSETLILAVPKGRILEELVPLLEKANIFPEKSFFNSEDRKLLFNSNIKGVQLIRVRSFDAATFVAYGGADMGVVGLDVLMEFNYPEIYSPLDLKIGKCRLSLARLKKEGKNFNKLSDQIKIATKYPEISRDFFAGKGLNVNCIKMNGAIELAPSLGLAENIVDLVSTGKTLNANGLVEVEKISDISSRLVVNRTAFKTRTNEVSEILSKFQEALNG